MSTEIHKASEAGRTFPFLKTSRLDLPGWKVALYSLAIVAMPIVGELLGEAFALISVLEILEAVPTLLCLVFVMRLPGPPALPVPRGQRIALIALASVLIMLSLGDLQSGGLSARAFTLALANALAIGVTEEVTFRWSLHRLWGHYGATFYVAASSLVFGLMHFPLGLQAVIVTAIIGTVFALARVAGMPILLLVVIHALMDLPQMLYRFSSIAPNF